MPFCYFNFYAFIQNVCWDWKSFFLPFDVCLNIKMFQCINLKYILKFLFIYFALQDWWWKETNANVLFLTVAPFVEMTQMRKSSYD